eukprot:3350142-Lingulodinium_polyedra.AAC.1
MNILARGPQRPPPRRDPKTVFFIINDSTERSLSEHPPAGGPTRPRWLRLRGRGGGGGAPRATPQEFGPSCARAT